MWCEARAGDKESVLRPLAPSNTEILDLDMGQGKPFSMSRTSSFAVLLKTSLHICGLAYVQNACRRGVKDINAEGDRD